MKVFFLSENNLRNSYHHNSNNYLPERNCFPNPYGFGKLSNGLCSQFIRGGQAWDWTGNVPLSCVLLRTRWVRVGSICWTNWVIFNMRIWEHLWFSWLKISFPPEPLGSHPTNNIEVVLSFFPLSGRSCHKACLGLLISIKINSLHQIHFWSSFTQDLQLYHRAVYSIWRRADSSFKNDFCVCGKGLLKPTWRDSDFWVHWPYRIIFFPTYLRWN